MAAAAAGEGEGEGEGLPQVGRKASSEMTTHTAGGEVAEEAERGAARPECASERRRADSAAACFSAALAAAAARRSAGEYHTREGRGIEERRHEHDASHGDGVQSLPLRESHYFSGSCCALSTVVPAPSSFRVFAAEESPAPAASSRCCSALRADVAAAAASRASSLACEKWGRDGSLEKRMHQNIITAPPMGALEATPKGNRLAGTGGSGRGSASTAQRSAPPLRPRRPAPPRPSPPPPRVLPLHRRRGRPRPRPRGHRRCRSCRGGRLVPEGPRLPARSGISSGRRPRPRRRIER